MHTINTADKHHPAAAPQPDAVPETSATPVLMPQKAELPLPREHQHQVAVPASINGHSLATGKP